jgi:alpha-glucosidase
MTSRHQRPPSDNDPDWWRTAVVYQIYPRSFADGNGDGLGDLLGVDARIDHLMSLGVDAVWFSPFYPSALADGGYDVDDYRDIDPRIGTLADFEGLVASMHSAGIKVMTDLVPNHTSNRHAWFIEALTAGRGSAARARYHFQEGRGPRGSLPPNDWQSIFGGPAWEPVGDGQWYLHVFAPEQPDLNWDHPEVRDDFLHTIRFWAERGVDGFRVDVAHGLAKDLTEPWLPHSHMTPDSPITPGDHPWWDRDEVHEIYAAWRTVFEEYDPPLAAIAECFASPERRGRYAAGSGLGQTFDFELLEAPFDAEAFRTAVDQGMARSAASGSANAWVLSNHDVVRHASRYGLPSGTPESAAAWLLTNGTVPRLDRELGVRRARAAILFVLALPGAAYLYQGEELGLHEVPDLPPRALQDPAWIRSGQTVKGRDGCRVPLPWTVNGSSFGFGSGGSHLPQPECFGQVSVEAQEADTGSTLTLYREALTARRRLLRGVGAEWEPSPDGVLHLRRDGGWHCLTSFRDDAIPLAETAIPPGSRLLLASTKPGPDDIVPPVSTSWWRSPAHEETR